MADEKIERIQPEPEGADYRSLGLAITQAAVGGASAGVAGALTNQAVNAYGSRRTSSRRRTSRSGCRKLG
jgi:hypothetical protein